MYPLDCEGIGEHCADSCHVELGRVRSVGFIDPCYDLDINSQESWDTGVLNGYITIVPQTNGQLEIAQLQGDGYGKRPQTNTVKEFTLTYHDPVFLGNYSFYNQASGQHKYKIFFRTSDAIYFSDTAVLITPNFAIENDLGQRIDWQVVLTWRSKSFPIVNTQLNADYLFACSTCTPSICFFIQSITGNLVDNSDPCNPVVNAAVSSDLGNGLTLGTDGLPYFSGGGTTWISGSGIPSILIGSVGNYYIDTDNGNIYLKTAVFGWLLIADIEGKVPYTGAIADVDLGAYKITADAVEFSLTPTNSPGPGQIAYKGTTGALAYLMNNSAVECEIGQQLYAYVINVDSVTINKGQPVYIFGASGNKASIKRANNTSDATSAKTLGLAAENIGVNQKGFVICQGVLDGLNTGMYTDGDILYVGATAGALTNIKPYAPNHLVYIGVVERANNGAGQIYVRAQNGYELDEIHDVDLITTPPVNNDILTYVTGTPNLWKPRSIASILGYTPLSAAIQSLGGQTGATQTLATGTSGTDFGISSASNTHTFNLPMASAANTGKLSNTDWSTFNNKQNALGFTPENVANKTDLMAGNTTSSTKYLSAKGVYDWVTNEFDPLIKRHYFDDLQGMGTGLTGSIFTGTGTLQLEGNISITRSGTAATFARTASEAGHSGIIRGGTGTTNSGACNIAYRGIWMGTNDWVYETSLRIQTLSTATERFTLFFQFGTGTTDSIRLFYSDNVNSGKWQAETYASSVSTTQDTGITVAINTWYNLKIVRLSNVITFYINGSLVATISTNVPSSFDTNAGVFLTKTVGTTTRTCDFDYVKLYDL